MDNYGTHKTAAVKRWFERHPEYRPHFTPTSGSWLNQVERFFALTTEKQIRRGVHQSVAQLKAATTGFIDQRNVAPKPFRWTKSASDILASVERFCVRTLQTNTAP